MSGGVDAKELKSDFAGDRLPCGQFEANALYFHLCVTAYNLFVLFRHSLPPEWHTRRAITIRWRLYALAAKVVCHARRVYLKFRPDQAPSGEVPAGGPGAAGAPAAADRRGVVLPGPVSFITPRAPGDARPCPCDRPDPVNLPVVAPGWHGNGTSPPLSGQIIAHCY